MPNAHSQTMKQIGVQIRMGRKRAGLAQAELARMVGVSVGPLHRIEAGTGNPRLSTLVAVLDALGLELTVASRSTIGEA